MWATLARPPKQSIEIYDAIEQMLAEHPEIDSRQKAFRRLAEASDGKLKLGNISTAYYRQARRLQKASGTKPPSAAHRAATAEAGLSDLQRIAEELSKLAAELVDRVEQERRELEEQRAKVERAKQAIIDA
jgi:predicted  nucleic acid-binding Zn-ribbon protein